MAIRRAMNEIRFSRELLGQNVHEIVEDGIEAETLGFDYVWVPDHLVDIQPPGSIFDTWTVLATIGARTRKIYLASGVTDIQRVHPAKTANIISTLHNLTNGRAVLGIGAGEIMNTKPFGIDWEPKSTRAKRLKEYLGVVRLLWSSSYEHSVSFKGEFYNLFDAYLGYPPLRESPLIYIGAFSSERLLGFVGESEDGWYPASYYSPTSFSKKVQIIRENAIRANRNVEGIDLIAKVPTVVCKNEDEFIEVKVKIKHLMKRQMLTTQYLLKDLGLEPEELGVPRELEYQLAAPGPSYDAALRKAISNLSVDDEILEKGIDTMMAVGSTDHCISSIESFLKAGATHILFASVEGGRESYRDIAREIMPHFRNDNSD